MSETKDTILLIDANALVHRAYHAFPKTLVTQKGQLVNAAYGFTRLLLQILHDFHPEYVMCAFDTHAPTFRHKLYSEYKATRKKPEEDLINQYPNVYEVLKALNIPTISVPGLEADDIIGSFSVKKELKDLQNIIVTGDKDLLQLINKNTQVFLTGTTFTKSVLLDETKAKEKLGFDPILLIDYKSLRGDPSDNIPGVNGIGDKTATTLIQSYSTLEGVYEHLNDLKPTMKEKLEKEKDIAFLSKDLATIHLNEAIPFTLSDAKLSDYDRDKVVKLFLELEFRTLIPKLPLVEKLIVPVQDEQLGLLSQASKPADTVIRKIKILEKEDEITSYLKKLENEKDIVLLIDPLIPNSIWSKVKGIVIATDDQSEYISGKSLSKNTLGNITEFLNNKNIITYGAKEQYHYLLSSDISGLRFDFDILLAGFILGTYKGYTDLSSLAFSALGIVIDNFDNSELTLLHKAKATMKLFRHFKEKLDKEPILANGWGLKKLCFDLEMPLIDVLIQMERKGIHLDADYLNKFAKNLDTEITELTKEIYKEAGVEFNINSPKQLSEVLFDRLKLEGKKKNKSGGYSTNERVLINLIGTAPIIKPILEYRELSKLRSTYTGALIDLIDKNSNKIHTTYKQIVASTGRLTSEKPNLQNIPVSTERGLEIRRAFKSSEDTIFVFFDYSQQELRLLAHFSEEPKLVEAFMQNKDIHALTAAMIFEKDIKDISKSERRTAKTVNFGVIYGISSFGLSEQLKIPREESQRFIDLFYTSYPRVRKFYDMLIEHARNNGQVSTMLGRRRNADALLSSNYQIRSAAEREIINFPLQGSAADMMKLAMLRANKLLQTKYQGWADLVLQVHDELIFEVKEKEVTGKKIRAFIEEIHKEMTEVLKLSVPIKVDIEYGMNLADKTKYN